jgi:prepilin-type N-terminal cleavage/methylation domain-containing protein
MLQPEKKTKGFSLIELLVVIALFGILASVAYPSFSSWMATRNTNDAVTKMESAFKSITTQIQRGVYPFGQVHVSNGQDEVVIVTRGMGQENFNQRRLTLNCSEDEGAWDASNINYFKSEYATVNLAPGGEEDAPTTGAICFSKDGKYYSGAGEFAASGSVDTVIFICSRPEAIEFSDGNSPFCQVEIDDTDEFNPVVKPLYVDSKNFYSISWSIFGTIVTEKWSSKDGGKWIERQ